MTKKAIITAIRNGYSGALDAYREETGNPWDRRLGDAQIPDDASDEAKFAFGVLRCHRKTLDDIDS